MTDQHPITPRPELVRQWASEKVYDERDWLYELHIARHAARWGADQELEACSEWLLNSAPWTVDPNERPEWVQTLKRCRRPKPPSLKEQALAELAATERCYPADYSTIRRALEQLDD